MAEYYFERVLFVVGEQNAGKSVQLRSLFQDPRFNRNCIIPKSKSIPEVYKLSNERSLYLRLTLPHETYETLDLKQYPKAKENFIEKTKRKLVTHTPGQGKRWNFACPLQPYPAGYMPDLVKTVDAFINEFHPERTRIVFLSPDQDKVCLQPEHLSHPPQNPLVDGLRDIPKSKKYTEDIEICWIDARERTPNGLFLADFFDFS